MASEPTAAQGREGGEYCYCPPEIRAVCSDPKCPNRTSSAASPSPPEDALVIAEVLLRIKNAVADMPRRADGCVNAHDLWEALDWAFEEAEKEAHA